MALNTLVQSNVKYGYSDLRFVLFEIAEWLNTVGWEIKYQFPNAKEKFDAQGGYSFVAVPRGDSQNMFDSELIALKMATKTVSGSEFSYQTIEAHVTPQLQCDFSNGQVIQDARGVTSGNLGPDYDYTYTEAGVEHRANTGDGLFFDTKVVKGRLKAHPVSWRASSTEHGLFLAIWLEGDEHRDPPTQSWFVVQRPVDQSDGQPLREPDADGSRNPIFCMYGISNESNTRSAAHQAAYEKYAQENGIPYTQTLGSTSSGPQSSITPSPDATKQGAIALKRFVVREKDVNAPGKQYDAWRNDRDMNAIINLRQQQARIEMRDIGVASIEKAGSRYAILFPSKLNTPRFRFKHELDMVAYTSADVISSGLPVNVHVYGEKDPETQEKLYRRYIAIQPTGPFNTNLIMLHLIKSGIPESEIKK
ncbi:hypothetical protein HUZ36_14080 [Pseudoalteromonas sp. McH1-7]|uniref:Uncharacterized protein n=1 Tax=Pseudoalteromonas peptidolytica F12-50-A1 TaxID=1315280 RepID=A0A8I0MYW7_9GAMM|nr:MULTISPECIES: hypothetical protein [Pseudoalteromonas]MBE0347863.1 hypothetical protein [Pseudoalteromonas peptidolytica F12-50-A1]MDW7551297.1 hypothetical protein [Pseudoalteromonas peptidolytica]NLR15337.1 hypothetical protein [Pseudoalteromonas peptidolytica]NUZ11912.1 hypothetical protein [Pseudoalteromonas sp. McH1-7]RRS09102.1 hypothetical protein EAG18_08255 [Pseudoalteromonas sp. J010]